MVLEECGFRRDRHHHACSREGLFLAIMAADLPPGCIYKEEEITVSQIKKTFRFLLAIGVVAASGIAYSQSPALTDAMKARIAPVGSLCKSGETCAAAPVAVSAEPKSGKEVYDSSCTTCHAVGVSGAPKMGHPEDWNPRLANGIDTLYTHAINGFNAMPAKGLCMACSDDEVTAAVDYMLENSK